MVRIHLAGSCADINICDLVKLNNSCWARYWEEGSVIHHERLRVINRKQNKNIFRS